MRMPNLFWRGMIIALIPFLAQLIIVVALATFLHKIRTEIVLESQSQEIIARAFVLNRDVMEVVYNLSTSFGSASENTDEQAQGLQIVTHPEQMPTRDLALLNKNLQSLTQIARQDRDSQTKIEEVKRTHEGLIDLYNKACSQRFVNIEEKVDFTANFYPRLLRAVKDYANAANEVVANEEQVQAKRPALIHALVRKVWITLFAAIALGLILAIILGCLYIVLVKRPLKKACETARLLAKGLPLPAESKGDDELSEMDRLLHSAATALEKVAESEKSLIENAADLICSLTENGVFLSANPFSLHMFGWKQEELVGRNLNALSIPEETLLCDEKLREIRNSAGIKSFELRMQTAGSGIIDTRWSCVWSEAQKVYFCVAHDITENKNAERLKQDLIDMISHDLRSPLTSVHICLAILARGARGELPPAIKQKIDRASQNIDHLVELVTDLLDFQKLNSGKMDLEMTLSSIITIVSDALKPIEYQAESRGISIEISGDDCQVRGDSQRLSQAIQLLLANAVAAGSANTKVGIQIVKQDKIVEIRVTDTGEHIDKTKFEHILKPFPSFEHSAAGKRSLLKLSICKSIIDAHGGELGVGIDKNPELPDRNSNAAIFWIRLKLENQVA